MSAFDQVTRRLDEQMSALSREQQGVVLWVWMNAVRPDLMAMGSRVATSVFEEIHEALRETILGRPHKSPQFSDEFLDSITPQSGSGGARLTASQDAMVAATVALDFIEGAGAQIQAAWYMLEACFQEQSQRDFGVTDVGSDMAEVAENSMVQREPLVSAIGAVASVIRDVSSESNPSAALTRFKDCLMPLALTSPWWNGTG